MVGMAEDATWITAPMLAWHDPAARRLPWRTTTEPYAVLVSEIMAQQTQATRAGQSWTGFMRRFPTLADLARAPGAAVIDAWQGLGYNRRAVNLHRCAQVVVAEHGGCLPDDLAGLEALPGIGPYTARAVLAFAHDRDVVPVDTNVARVLARTGDVVLTRPRAQAVADSLPGPGAGGARLSGALMDLGATVCTARQPRCGECPLQQRCGWAGGPGPDPAAAGDHRPRRQAAFAGSARQSRGRIVAALRAGPVPTPQALLLAGDHGQALLDRLVADGLAEPTGGGFALPGYGGMD
ncbi:A/G-specific adenine glycosylase [soil metagenome]